MTIHTKNKSLIQVVSGDQVKGNGNEIVYNGDETGTLYIMGNGNKLRGYGTSKLGTLTLIGNSNELSIHALLMNIEGNNNAFGEGGSAYETKIKGNNYITPQKMFDSVSAAPLTMATDDVVMHFRGGVGRIITGADDSDLGFDSESDDDCTKKPVYYPASTSATATEHVTQTQNFGGAHITKSTFESGAHNVVETGVPKSIPLPTSSKFNFSGAKFYGDVVVGDGTTMTISNQQFGPNSTQTIVEGNHHVTIVKSGPLPSPFGRGASPSSK